MKTNINYTYEILGGYLMSNNKLNVGYFADAVMLFSDNDETLYKERFNTRRKTRNIAINELMSFINRELKFAGYTGYYASNAQVMKWDKEHDGGLEAALDIIEANVIQTREECK